MNIEQIMIQISFFCICSWIILSASILVALTIVLRRGGYGKIVQRELESRRQLVDYTGGMGSQFNSCKHIDYLLNVFLYVL